MKCKQALLLVTKVSSVCGVIEVKAGDNASEYFLDLCGSEVFDKDAAYFYVWEFEKPSPDEDCVLSLLGNVVPAYKLPTERGYYALFELKDYND